MTSTTAALLHGVFHCIACSSTLGLLLWIRQRCSSLAHYSIPCPFNPREAKLPKLQLRRTRSWPQWLRKWVYARSLASGYRMDWYTSSPAIFLYIIQMVLLTALYLSFSKAMRPLQTIVRRCGTLIDNIILQQVYVSGICLYTFNLPMLTIVLTCGAAIAIEPDTRFATALDASLAGYMFLQVGYKNIELALDVLHDYSLAHNIRPTTYLMQLSHAVRLLGICFEAGSYHSLMAHSVALILHAIAAILFAHCEQIILEQGVRARQYTFLPILTHDQSRQLQILDGSGLTSRQFPEGYVTQIRRADKHLHATFSARQYKYNQSLD